MNIRRTRRGLVPLLAAAALVVAACGGDDDAATPDAPEAPDEPATEEPADDPADEPADDPADEPAEEPADEPDTTDAPAAGSGEMTVLDELTSVSVQSDWFPSTDHAALYAAEYFGFFAERNLDVEIREGGPGIRAANDVVTGNVTFGMAIPENIVLAASEGAELTTFFATYQESPIGIMVHAESGITGLDDLTEVQMFPGQVFWEVLKAENDLDVDEIAYDGSQAAWLENIEWGVQAFATTNPNVARENGADPVMLTATELGFRSYATTIFTSDEYAAENPDVVRAFAEAIQAGLEAFLDDPDPVIAYINEVYPDFEISVGEASFPVMVELVVSDTTDELGLGTMSGEVWEGVASRMFAADIIRTEVDADSLWTNEFLVG